MTTVREPQLQLDAPQRSELERVAAEIVGSPVYLLWTEELPPGHWIAGEVALCHRVDGDAEYRDIIGDRWSGRGGCVVLCRDALRREAETLRTAWPHVGVDRLFTWTLLSTFAHELTHVVRDCILPRRDSPVPPPSKRWKNAVKALADAGPDRKPLGGSVPFVGHDAKFLRAAAHVGTRLGEILGIDFLLELYPPACFSHSWLYLSSLGDEMARLRDEPLSQLDSIAPPTVFSDLWRADLKKWLLGLDQISDSQFAAFVDGMKLFT